jgi:hypothetical protein
MLKKIPFAILGCGDFFWFFPSEFTFKKKRVGF